MPPLFGVGCWCCCVGGMEVGEAERGAKGEGREGEHQGKINIFLTKTYMKLANGSAGASLRCIL